MHVYFLVVKDDVLFCDWAAIAYSHILEHSSRTLTLECEVLVHKHTSK